MQTNERPFDGRVYVMVLDDLHTSPPNTSLVPAAAQAVHRRKLGANDLMAVVYTRGAAGGGRVGQEFTNNKRLLGARRGERSPGQTPRRRR